VNETISARPAQSRAENDSFSVRSAPSRAEKEALKCLLRLAYAVTRYRGDIYVGRHTDRQGRVRLEAWARELDPAVAESTIPLRLREAADSAAFDLGGRLEVAPDHAGRKIVFRIDSAPQASR